MWQVIVRPIAERMALIRHRDMQGVVQSVDPTQRLSLGITSSRNASIFAQALHHSVEHSGFMHVDDISESDKKSTTVLATFSMAIQ